MTRRIRERGRGGWLGLSPGRFCKKREKKRRRKEERGHLAKIHLNFENSKIPRRR
jgi:hypothetical protein